MEDWTRMAKEEALHTLSEPLEVRVGRVALKKEARALILLMAPLPSMANSLVRWALVWLVRTRSLAWDRTDFWDRVDLEGEGGGVGGFVVVPFGVPWLRRGLVWMWTSSVVVLGGRVLGFLEWGGLEWSASRRSGDPIFNLSLSFFGELESWAFSEGVLGVGMLPLMALSCSMKGERARSICVLVVSAILAC